MVEISEAIIEVLQEDNPQTLRHVFYRLCGAPYGLVPKTEAGYATIKRVLLNLRKTGDVPWRWVSDNTRWQRKSISYGSLAEAVRATASTYRRDLWRRTPKYVEVWCESDSLAGSIIEETDRYNIALMVSRGFASATYLHSAGEMILAQGKPAFLYYIGDWDPSGRLIPEVILRQLREFAPGVPIEWKRLLVTPEQIEEWRLPTKPAKKTTHGMGFTGGTVEAEAIPAQLTRQIVRDAIEQHVDPHEVAQLRAAEESEADYLHAIADMIEQEDLS